MDRGIPRPRTLSSPPEQQLRACVNSCASSVFEYEHGGSGIVECCPAPCGIYMQGRTRRRPDPHVPAPLLEDELRGTDRESLTCRDGGGARGVGELAEAEVAGAACGQVGGGRATAHAEETARDGGGGVRDEAVGEGGKACLCEGAEDGECSERCRLGEEVVGACGR